jgi:predicted enzyme related to lactoylglutathione lyase
MKKRVTGIGGIFFKSEDPSQLNSWYARHLGMEVSEWGTVFKWRELEGDAKVPAQTVWNPFKASTNYFSPSEKPFMINYRVEDLAGLLEALRSEGVTIIGEMQEFSYGKFGWIMDPEGNKIELWEPVDDGF